ncbi:chromosome segregation protein SMC [Roseibium album]|uniref:Chromosome partition protein Smc n=1 Tax=Roseibium album TaxID=311410 RepID=A0A0M7AGA5_9HYPH|nr:chromosome segregation protein SMC [Roseibium album]CTQ60952.1 Chromosome partition protein Smc [Roseibium album]CTQ64460.1 Chromosome partition protein Smc [Roseibium album]CTQ72773.1 Chromosome partition protein Smc [Roseibium album]
MKFSKLRIVGFKSFVEPMEFIIGDGLTGVVGPNGCGKSNLVEALRWVMGENSYKNMRASGMDDVIFSGSLNRPARNTAEVTLFLDNPDRTAPTAFNDADLLEVSRRIEREQGSNYKINAKDVRARDVQLLFADASTGARSPAMVRQGQIGELIAAKPTSRRQILEEAAGISGLHSRRHEAEIRLRAAEQNLERLEDVLVQIDGQLDNLKRQSRQASRYRNLSSEIRAAEASILFIRWTESRNALSVAENQFAEAQKQVNEATALQAESARVQAIAAHKLPELRDEAVKAAAALQRLVIARNELDAEERRVKERLQDLERRLVQLAEDIRREQAMVSENDEVLERLSEERAELLEENEMVQERTDSARESVSEAEETVRANETRLSDLTAAEARASAERRQLERAVAETRQRAERLVAQAQEAQQALDALNSQLAENDGVSENREALELAEETLLEADAAAEEAEHATREAREQEQSARGPLSDAQQALQGLETEARTLDQVLNVHSDQDFTPVVEQVQVEQGFETALGAALGEDLDASLEETAAVKWGTPLPGDRDPVLPSGIRSLADVVVAPAELARRLRQVGIVDQHEGPARRAELLPGQRLVSRDGDLWRWDGFLVAANAPTPAAQRLAQKNRLAELADEIDTARGELEGRQQDLETAATRVRQSVELEQSARGKVRDGQRKAAAAREALVTAERSISQLAAKKAAAQDRSERIAEEAELAREQVVEADERLADAPESANYQEQISDLQEEVAAARGALAEARAVSEGLAREQQMRDRRLEAIAREYDSWKTRASNAARQITVLTERREEAEEERAELIEAPEDIEIKRRQLFSAISKAEDEKKTRDDQLQQAELDLSEVDRAARAAMEALAGAREQKIRAEERFEASKERKGNLERRIDEDLEVPVTALPEIAGLKEGAPLPDPAATERKLERLKAERERLGGVNLRAEEELKEIDEQKTTLTSERDDLIEAIRRLRTGISNLNREARERLLASFEVVNGHFQRLFTHLFGGGTAELQLVDSDDPLDAGLEIIARPPGKKPQTMTLLSGGEQALTAMSLIFAVFLTNPAPICVLDEVDAPLDDANVERYCDLLDEMIASTETRFVVITHNPITMARMNRLFGVTMAERGVSQLVSVDLETAERFRETA